MPRRLFIAVDISDEARTVASGIIDDLRRRFSVKGISWVKPDNLHITIKFLGDTDADTEAKLIEALDSIARHTPAFMLKFEGGEVLGKKVIAIKITSDDATVFALEMQLDTECERLGFKREGRRFHPHLTLARIRDPKAAARTVQEFRKVQIMPVKFEVREIVLHESKLMPSGSVYNAVRTINLKV